MSLDALRSVKSAVAAWCGAHLNFYRIHLVYFTFTPLIASVIFWGSNGDHEYSYIDSLFICVSAICVCGLAPVRLSPATPWQQAIIMILICAGSLTSVSLVTILIRLKFFRQKFKQLVETDPNARKRIEDMEACKDVREDERTIFQFLHPSNLVFRSTTNNRSEKEQDHEHSPPRSPLTPPPSGTGTPRKGGKKRKLDKLRPDMIRKVDNHSEMQEAINRLAQERQAQEQMAAKDQMPTDISHHSLSQPVDEKKAPDLSYNVEQALIESPRHSQSIAGSTDDNENALIDSEDEAEIASPASHRRALGTLPQNKTMDSGDLRRFATAHTIDFREDAAASMRRRRRSTNFASNAEAFPRTRTGNFSAYSGAKHTGYGGFANPVTSIAKMVGSRVQDNVSEMVRTRTMQNTGTIQPTRTMTGRSINMQRTGTWTSAGGLDQKPAPYITFDAIVGRNSRFKALSTAQQEELGGVEFRALSLLWKIVAGYWLGFQVIAAIMTVPYLSTTQFHDRFADSGVTAAWYGAFNIWSAFSNTGLSLLDTSMVEFKATYYWVLVLCLLIVAGNTGFPIFLRLIIWTLSKAVPSNSRIKETLQFLLDHPRRSFLYLFPSYQTWFLVFVLMVLNCTDWFFFVVLDIGNAVLEALPLRIRVLDGFFQAVAVRAAGFNIIDVSATAPSLQVLYVIMMYVAVYPIALSIRSTNVYEERSMGLYEDDEDSQMEQNYAANRLTGSYIAYHARKQLAFDIWWLVFALWLVCIVERAQIEDHVTDAWFNVFTVLFEVTSAYGTVGLSLGSPETGTSLCGSFSTLSKLIIIAVIIRGRHRGLPNAIDRAVLLPSDMSLVEDQGLAADGGLSRFASMGRTTGPPVAPTMSSQHTRTGSQHGLRMDGDFSSASVAPRSQDFAPPRPPMSDGSGVEPSTGPHVGFQTPIRDVSPEPPASESEAPSNRSSTAVNSSS